MLSTTRIFLLCVLSTIASFSEVVAQNTINGRVVDENNAPVPNIEVLLHRVTKAGGGSVDTDTSDATGAFTLVAPPETDSTALFFVAVSENGELFMGEMQRLPFPTGMEYIVEAGDDPIQLTRPEIQPAERRAGLFVIIGCIILVTGVIVFAMRRRPPLERRLLVALANLDDHDPSPAVQRRRKELYARLKRGA